MELWLILLSLCNTNNINDTSCEPVAQIRLIDNKPVDLDGCLGFIDSINEGVSVPKVIVPVVDNRYIVLSCYRYK